MLPKGTIFPVDGGFVELVDYMGNDLTVTNAARVSFGKRKTAFDEKDISLITFLANNGHTSPFRHVMLQLHFKMPEFVARQMYKHIVGSDYAFKDTAWNEISGRYVELVEFWTPEYLRQKADNKKQGSLDEKHPMSDEYIAEMVALQKEIYQLYTTMLKNGVAPEQARTILPVSFFTEFYWTASLQAILHFVKLRNHNEAQKEIQVYAKVVEHIVSELFPQSHFAFRENA